jgi:hypothetical protein
MKIGHIATQQMLNQQQQRSGVSDDTLSAWTVVQNEIEKHPCPQCKVSISLNSQVGKEVIRQLGIAGTNPRDIHSAKQLAR